MKPVELKPVGKINIWRLILSKIPFHCSHCGKMYVSCHSDKINLLMPVPQNGKCCPNGHEGYTDEFMGFVTVRHYFDHVKTNP